MNRWLEWLANQLAPLVSTPGELRRWKEHGQRELLADDAFIKRFYHGSEIPPDIPLRLRKVYADQLGMDRVRPSDQAHEFLDLDYADLLHEVGAEFGVKFTKPMMNRMVSDSDMSFDSIVHYLVQLRRETSR